MKLGVVPDSGFQTHWSTVGQVAGAKVWENCRSSIRRNALLPMKKTLHRWLNKLGPGLITGAADDDPSGIATYSQAGAQYGFGTLWTLLFTYPLMVGIQVISARIGCVTGRGLAVNLGKTNSRGVTISLVMLLLVANTINIGADLAAMADALALVIGGPSHIYAVAFGMICLLLQVFIPYRHYVGVLKWLTLTLFAYVGTVFASHVPWLDVLHGTLLPKIQHSQNYLLLLVAIFGTTISPYLFFWQAGQEVEELKLQRAGASLRRLPEDATQHLRRINIDTGLGMAFSQLIAFFIMLTTAVTLYTHGVHDIQTSSEAAEALRPVGGNHYTNGHVISSKQYDKQYDIDSLHCFQSNVNEQLLFTDYHTPKILSNIRLNNSGFRPRVCKH